MSTSTTHANTLDSFPRNFEFLLGIDSVACVFDSMEIKQKECFCPAGGFADAYERSLIVEFESFLPFTLPWTRQTS